MSEASDKLALFLATEHESLAKALREMAAFEQALGSKTAFYRYPLTPDNQRYAKQRGLILIKQIASVKDASSCWAPTVKLTKYGREVVNSLDMIAEAS